jgi:hypothetical protein
VFSVPLRTSWAAVYSRKSAVAVLRPTLQKRFDSWLTVSQLPIACGPGSVLSTQPLSWTPAGTKRLPLSYAPVVLTCEYSAL